MRVVGVVVGVVGELPRQKPFLHFSEIEIFLQPPSDPDNLYTLLGFIVLEYAEPVSQWVFKKEIFLSENCLVKSVTVSIAGVE